jgi:hypothetical protein
VCTATSLGLLNHCSVLYSVYLVSKVEIDFGSRFLAYRIPLFLQMTFTLCTAFLGSPGLHDPPARTRLDNFFQPIISSTNSTLKYEIMPYDLRVLVSGQSCRQDAGDIRKAVYHRTKMITQTRNRLSLNPFITNGILLLARFTPAIPSRLIRDGLCARHGVRTTSTRFIQRAFRG